MHSLAQGGAQDEVGGGPLHLLLEKSVLHHLDGAGAVTRCSSGSDNGIYHG
jgi:hypothetical protein